MNKSLAIAILLLATASCCGHRTSYSQFEELPARGWAFGDTLRFMPDTTETAFLEEGNLLLSIRHDNSYEYSNLWLSLEYCDGENCRRDTLEIALSDLYGNWYGRGLGIVFQKTDTIAKRIRLPKGKPIKVSHIMRPDTLRGIEQIGIIYSGER